MGSYCQWAAALDLAADLETAYYTLQKDWCPSVVTELVRPFGIVIALAVGMVVALQMVTKIAVDLVVARIVAVRVLTCSWQKGLWIVVEALERSLVEIWGTVTVVVVCQYSSLTF